MLDENVEKKKMGGEGLFFFKLNFDEVLEETRRGNDQEKDMLEMESVRSMTIDVMLPQKEKKSLRVFSSAWTLTFFTRTWNSLICALREGNK